MPEQVQVVHGDSSWDLLDIISQSVVKIDEMVATVDGAKERTVHEHHLQLIPSLTIIRMMFKEHLEDVEVVHLDDKLNSLEPISILGVLLDPSIESLNGNDVTTTIRDPGGNVKDCVTSVNCSLVKHVPGFQPFNLTPDLAREQSSQRSDQLLQILEIEGLREVQEASDSMLVGSFESSGHSLNDGVATVSPHLLLAIGNAINEINFIFSHLAVIYVIIYVILSLDLNNSFFLFLLFKIEADSFWMGQPGC